MFKYHLVNNISQHWTHTECVSNRLTISNRHIITNTHTQTPGHLKRLEDINLENKQQNFYFKIIDNFSNTFIHSSPTKCSHCPSTLHLLTLSIIMNTFSLNSLKLTKTKQKNTSIDIVTQKYVSLFIVFDEYSRWWKKDAKIGTGRRMYW